jgi:hypothetical protein
MSRTGVRAVKHGSLDEGYRDDRSDVGKDASHGIDSQCGGGKGKLPEKRPRALEVEPIAQPRPDTPSPGIFGADLQVELYGKFHMSNETVLRRGGKSPKVDECVELTPGAYPIGASFTNRHTARHAVFPKTNPCDGHCELLEPDTQTVAAAIEPCFPCRVEKGFGSVDRTEVSCRVRAKGVAGAQDGWRREGRGLWEGESKVEGRGSLLASQIRSVWAEVCGRLKKKFNVEQNMFIQEPFIG